MGAVNKVFILGRVGQDIETRVTSSGQVVANLSIATNEPIGGGKTHTEWHRVVCWGRTAEIAKQYLAKGKHVHVTGHLRTNKWEDKAGVTRYSTEIQAESIQLV